VLAQVSLTREVTVERVAEVKLERMQRLITAGQMAAGIAHNLNNVLGAIAVNADLMLAASPEEMPRLAREINHGVQRGSDVLNRLYHLSSVSQSPRRETLSVVNLFNHVVRLIGPQAEQRGVVVRVIAPEEVRVIADAGLLHQVLLNLVLNSLQAMPDGGYLTLSAHSDGPGRSLLIVADTGPGIPPEHLSQVFTPFFTTKEDAGGTGLGLATSRTMVCAMGGDIRLESAPGMGTKAYLGFPAPTRGLS
ncbi:MAG: sensor histidine kinase, partial [Bacillota bacterium]